MAGAACVWPVAVPQPARALPSISICHSSQQRTGSLHEYMAATFSFFPTACAATPTAPLYRTARKHFNICMLDIVESQNTTTYHSPLSLDSYQGEASIPDIARTGDLVGPRALRLGPFAAIGKLDIRLR